MGLTRIMNSGLPSSIPFAQNLNEAHLREYTLRFQDQTQVVRYFWASKIQGPSGETLVSLRLCLQSKVCQVMPLTPRD